MKMIKMASCDDLGEVYIAGNAVYRIIPAKHESSISQILDIINQSKIPGIIDTEICEDKSIISSETHDLVLKHRKVEFISYPHEWCASMLKDAALLHIQLSIDLLSHNLFLKDAHPWNILFENHTPILVDITSIVSKKLIQEEEYLHANTLFKDADPDTRLSQLHKEIFERMYIPYFINPLLGYTYGQPSKISKLIEKTTLNASTSTIRLADCLPSFKKSTLKKLPEKITKTVNIYKSQRNLKKAINNLITKKDTFAFHQEIYNAVKKLEIPIRNTGYSNYYNLKGENNSWSNQKDWNDKQKTMYKALNTPETHTVLDVACNTGWFAVLAEKAGKRVVAFDIDAGCIEILYKQIKNERLNILPLILDFTRLTSNRYSIYDGKLVLINAAQRLRADSVIALGIIHHLILGAGLSFKQVLDSLTALSKKQIILEFIDKNDAMIANEPNFFPALTKNKDLLLKYEIKELVMLIEKNGFDVHIEKSYPSTRSILICNKRFTA